MMEPKPLTKEELERIAMMVGHSRTPWQQATLKLLAAEAYWREALRNAEFRTREDGCGYYECTFCGRMGDPIDNGHAPDCPWLLAQEGPK